jgi:hypothetical protein
MSLLPHAPAWACLPRAAAWAHLPEGGGLGMPTVGGCRLPVDLLVGFCLLKKQKQVEKPNQRRPKSVS